jgi:Fe-S-cluster containining protein
MSADAEHPAEPAALAQQLNARTVERQLEREGLFLHSRLTELNIHAYDTDAAVVDLVELLLAKGVLQDEDLTPATRAVRAPIEDRAMRGLRVAIRDDSKDAEAAEPEINCAERMPYCHAICCSMLFPLTRAEIEAGLIKWDLGQPYLIRHEDDGYCTHCDPDTRACGVYDVRPKPCRNFTCKDDPRIWIDFEKMIPNADAIQVAREAQQPRFTPLDGGRGPAAG